MIAPASATASKVAVTTSRRAAINTVRAASSTVQAIFAHRVTHFSIFMPTSVMAHYRYPINSKLVVTEAAVRHRLNQAMRQSLTDEEWVLLGKLGDVDDLIADPDMVDGVADKVRAMRTAYRAAPAGSTDPSRTLQPSQTASVGDRSTAFAFALSENIAAIADQDLQTAAFRTAHLPDGLITLDQVDAWITQRAKDQSEETRQARVRVPAGWQPGTPLSSTGAAVFVEQLHYVVPGQAHVQKVVVAPGAVLDSLRRLATELASAHGWEIPQAASWVLTGVTPLVGLIRITEGRDVIRNAWWMAWSERITLDVHAAATPDEVAEAYRAARLRHDLARTDGRHRVRAQSIPRLVLARFVARRGGTWEQKRVAWNTWVAGQTEYDDLKRYDYTGTFRRDAALGCKRVLYRGYYAGRGAATAAAADDGR